MNAVFRTFLLSLIGMVAFLMSVGHKSNESPHPSIQSGNIYPINDIDLAGLLFIKRNGALLIDTRPIEDFSNNTIDGAISSLDPRLYKILNEKSTANVPIVFFCSGSECGGARFMAVKIYRNLNASGSKFFVYGQGFREWASCGLPTSKGQISNDQ